MEYWHLYWEAFIWADLMIAQSIAEEESKESWGEVGKSLVVKTVKKKRKLPLTVHTKMKVGQ